jgi:hypothetical protein
MTAGIWTAFRYVDVEASGLHHGSYPVEVGWSDAWLEAGSMVVRPAPEWTPELWSPASEAIHGISRDETLASPHGVIECALALNDALGGLEVHTDNVGHDGNWLGMLFGRAGVRPAFGLRPLNDAWLDAMGSSGISMEEANLRIRSARVAFPHPHRARADAIAMAATVRAVAEPAWDLGIASSRKPDDT